MALAARKFTNDYYTVKWHQDLEDQVSELVLRIQVLVALQGGNAKPFTVTLLFYKAYAESLDGPYLTKLLEKRKLSVKSHSVGIWKINVPMKFIKAIDDPLNDLYRFVLKKCYPFHHVKYDFETLPFGKLELKTHDYPTTGGILTDQATSIEFDNVSDAIIQKFNQLSQHVLSVTWILKSTGKQITFSPMYTEFRFKTDDKSVLAAQNKTTMLLLIASLNEIEQTTRCVLPIDLWKLLTSFLYVN